MIENGLADASAPTGYCGAAGVPRPMTAGPPPPSLVAIAAFSWKPLVTGELYQTPFEKRLAE